MTSIRKTPLFSRRNFLIFLGVLLVARLVLNLLLPLADPSEARYALICKIMSESGNFLEPRFIHEGVLMNFEGKPPLYFQMGAICCRLFGVSLFACRFPAFLFAAGILAAMYGTVRRIRDERTAQVAVLLTAACPVYFFFAGQVMTDMALAACIAWAVFSYMLFEFFPSGSRSRKLASAGFFASLAVGMLVKGPVVFVMAGIPVFCHVLIGNRWKELKDHAWIAGPVVFLLIAAPWYVMMQRKNPDFLEYFFVNENFKRFLFKEYGDQYGAGRESFRGMSVLFFLLDNAPAFLLLAFPLADRMKRKLIITRESFRSIETGLPLLGVICITGFWCLTSRLLITYLLPTSVFFAVWLTFVLDDTACLDDAAILCRRTLRIGIPSAAILCVIGHAVVCLIADRSISSMPGSFFRRIAKECPAGELYFYRRVPYSAYFYLGSRVIPHANEEVTVSGEHAEPYLMVARKTDLKKYPLKKTRPAPMLENGSWVLLPKPEIVSDSPKMTHPE